MKSFVKVPCESPRVYALPGSKAEDARNHAEPCVVPDLGCARPCFERMRRGLRQVEERAALLVRDSIQKPQNPNDWKARDERDGESDWTRPVGATALWSRQCRGAGVLIILFRLAREKCSVSV
jgi:hypothetical protein